MFFPDLERILQCSKIQIIVLDHMLPCKIGSIIHFQHGNDFMEGGGGWGWGGSYSLYVLPMHHNICINQSSWYIYTPIFNEKPYKFLISVDMLNVSSI